MATNGATELLARLHHAGIRHGGILDLGCGGGVAARILTDAGYAVTGVDLSEPLLAIARERVPEATFLAQSFLDLDMARDKLVAVCAFGEVLNYLFDDRNSPAALATVIHNVARALPKGGVFLFDLSGPGRASAQPIRNFIEGDDWAVLTELSAQDQILTRRIVTFYREGDHYRRDAEVHRQLLFAPETVLSNLRAAGLAPTTLDRYAQFGFPGGWSGYLAIKRE